MEKTVKIKSEYCSLDKILEFVKKESSYECSIDYDSWDVRTDSNGQMEKCVLIKKSGMHGMKVFITSENEINMSYLIPNKMMNAYFGKSQKAHKGILEIITGLIKNAVLSGSQKKAYEEMELVLLKIAV